jgi:plastocyanin
MKTRFQRCLSLGAGVGGPKMAWQCRVGGVVAAFLVLVAAAALAAAIHKIVQKGRAFSVAEIEIARGDQVLFTNEDEFLHQIYVDSTDMDFDSPEQPPGRTIEITFSRSGTFRVRCHIHPKMQLIVRVD